MIQLNANMSGFIMAVLISPITSNQVMLSGLALTVQEKHLNHFVVINPSSHDLLIAELTSATSGRLARKGQTRLPFAATYLLYN